MNERSQLDTSYNQFNSVLEGPFMVFYDMQIFYQ
jgi:hypothetical protein